MKVNMFICTLILSIVFVSCQKGDDNIENDSIRKIILLPTNSLGTVRYSIEFPPKVQAGVNATIHVKATVLNGSPEAVTKYNFFDPSIGSIFENENIPTDNEYLQIQEFVFNSTEKGVAKIYTNAKIKDDNYIEIAVE